MLELKKLDDKSFEEIMAYAMERLPSLAPEWTDYNAHDPGITFLEMLSWLTEMQRYYLERITEKHELKYLKLLGITPLPAVPAKIAAMLEPINAVLKKGMKTNIAGIPFTLADDVVLSAAKIELSYAEDGESKDIYGFMPFGDNPAKDDCFYIRLSEALDSNTEYSIYIKLLQRDDMVRNPMQDGFYQLSEIALGAYTDGYWQDCVVCDRTHGFTQSGVIKFTLPGSSGLLRCSLSFCDIDIPPMFEWISLQTAEFVQIEELDRPMLFVDADNPISLNITPGIIVEESLSLFSEDCDGVHEWKITDDLSCSGPSDRHFELDPVNGLIIFGDNVHGKAPEKNITVNSMSLTLGGRGNIKENLNFAIAAGDKTINAQALFTCENGSDPETSNEAMKRFKAILQNQKLRAVTADDYVELIKKTPGLCIESATVYSPKAGKLIVCIKPHYGELSDAYIRNIRRYLFDKKLPCTEIDIIPPEFWECVLYTEIITEKWLGDHEKQIRKMLEDYAESVKNCFGITVSLSEQKRVLEESPYVKKVNELVLRRRNGDIIDTSEDYKLPPNGLLRIVDMNVVIGYKNEQ